MDCSWKNITKIQNLPESIVFLNVSHNLIKCISKGTFEAAKHLLTLDLSFNRLSSITVDTFIGLMKLRYLSLDNNKLIYNNRTFPTKSFRQLEFLSHLSLKNNNIRSSSCKSFPDKTIKDLAVLEPLELDASECGDKFLGKGFRALRKLNSLLQPKELPLVMLELVQKESYIEYPNDEQGNVVFWEKIKETLRTNVRA
ncbi:unnamed protein product [Mytilus edulis]|uniref:Uncharacterized protein n=1 Tax=Mytilus edulis TaxID=6550 RepID=A0A8S3ULG1_MYTED|nr:unnamed protein product [Mytilus edulis]